MLSTAAPIVTKACRSLSTTAKVWVDKNTKVICQGFTGKQVLDGQTLLVLSRVLLAATHRCGSRVFACQGLAHCCAVLVATAVNCAAGLSHCALFVHVALLASMVGVVMV